MRSLISLSFLLALFSCVQGAVVLKQPATLTGKPGTAVRLTCRTSGFDLSAYYMSWVRQVPGKGLEWLLWYYSSSRKVYAPGIESRVTVIREDSNNIFDLIIKSPTVHDTAIYYCARIDSIGTGVPLGYWGQGTMLTVTDATPRAPSLYALQPTCGSPTPEGQLTFGCLAADYSPEPATFSWTSNGSPITNEGEVKSYPSVLSKAGLYTASSQLTIQASEVDISSLRCQVKSSSWSADNVSFQGSDLSSPPVVLLTQTSPEDIAFAKQATLLCSVSGFSPDKLRVDWLKDGKALASGFKSSPSLDDNGTFSTDSRLTIPATDWTKDVVYSCKVTHDPSQTLIIKNITNWSPGPPDCPPAVPEVGVSLLPPSPRQLLTQANVNLTCIVTNAPSDVTVSWSRGQTALQSTHESRLDRRVVSKLEIPAQEWTSRKRYACQASHPTMASPKRAEISKSEVTPEQPSVYLLLPSAEELSSHQSVTLTCLVKDFAPKEILVEWTINGRAMGEDSYSNTEVMGTEAGLNHSMYSLLSISNSEWEQGNTYSCVVRHESMDQPKTRSINKSSGKPSFVNLSLVLMDNANGCQ